MAFAPSLLLAPVSVWGSSIPIPKRVRGSSEALSEDDLHLSRGWFNTDDDEPVLMLRALDAHERATARLHENIRRGDFVVSLQDEDVDVVDEESEEVAEQDADADADVDPEDDGDGVDIDEATGPLDAEQHDGDTIQGGEDDDEEFEDEDAGLDMDDGSAMVP
ncbi:hypothetical protein BJ742DRAFT_828954 [Cladochytrium replicatum]|nr:hypothetical protein BJ742DRAFT_828954 [Cladochytrium replicatum]